VSPARALQLAVKLAPSAASAGQRASQLVVLWALTAASAGTTQSQLVTGFGLIGTFVMISDSGAGNYLLARKDEDLTRAAFLRACGVHLVVTLSGVLVCAGFLFAVLDRPVSGQTVTVLVALALTQLGDNFSRVVRYPLLNQGREVAYSWPELVGSVGKTALAGFAGATGSLGLLVLLPVISATVLLLAVRPVRTVLRPDSGTPPRVRSILTFGLAGAINATYSQLPLIISSIVLANAQTAVLAALMRVFQALEIVPGTLALQAIPRYANGRSSLRRDALAMAAGAVLLSALFLPVLPLVGSILSIPLRFHLAVFFAGAFTARCVGYLVSSYYMGTGRIGLRLRITVRAALVMLPVVPVLVLVLGTLGGAISALAVEVLLTVLLALNVRGRLPGRERDAADLRDVVTP
jgi:O-antigen/teichoic acid export membrane protein